MLAKLNMYAVYTVMLHKTNKSNNTIYIIKKY